MEQDAYEESDLRLVDRISSPMITIPIPTPSEPPAMSLETPALSPLSVATTLVNNLADPHPAFHQNHAASYLTRIIP